MIIFEKFIFFLSRSDIGQKTFGLLSKTTGKGCKKCVLLVQRKIWGRTVFLNSSLFHLIPIVGKKIQPFVGKTSVVLSKLQSTCPFELFREKNIDLKKFNFFHHCGCSRGRFFDFRQKNFGSIVKTAFYVSRGGFRGKTFVYHVWMPGEYVFDFQQKTLRRVVKNASYVSGGMSSGIVSLYSNFLKPIWILAKVLGRCSKLHFQCPQEHL